MIQGCGSDVGKSVLTAGLCRLFANRGLLVRPFKPQNMSNNAAVTQDGGEIGRAQALQARAARVEPSVHMNPVLLKPQSDTGAQLVVRGRAAGEWQAGAYRDRKPRLLDTVLESYRHLRAEADLVLIEGAGSPAETNLRAGDIDRGHVIAALVGAHAVLEEADRAMIKGFIINKFRGDPALFDEGRAEIVRRTGWADCGMTPWLAAVRRLPAEDAVVLDRAVGADRRRVRVAVPMLSRIANFDDFDPLRAEPEVELGFVPPGRPIPGDADLVILPGTKATLADLAFLRAQGWDIDIAAHVRRGGRVLGVCGGYQMLGRRISDPSGVEGAPGEADGLGLLDVETVLAADKILRCVGGRLAGGAAFAGYEIHVGRTDGPDTVRPFLFHDDGAPDGAMSADGRVAGVYAHGLFDMASARSALLGDLGARSDGVDQDARVDAALDELAVALEAALDVGRLAAIAGLEQRR